MPAARRPTVWKCGDRTLALGERTLVMGILNVTPDSFSDGGRYLDTDRAIEHGRRLAAEGADILDVGGESTRPGSERVGAEEECRRVVPVIRALAGEVGCLLSVDTMKARVAEQAVEAGAVIINDVSALRADPAMPGVARASSAGVVLMHMQGEPRTMQEAPQYQDVVEEVAGFLEARVRACVEGGLAAEQLAVDPGIGFGKTLEHNLSLLRGVARLGRLGRPVLVGLSRKRFLGGITGREVGDRLAGSLGAMACVIARGAHILRVHDVKESCDVARVVDMLLAGE
ncbi:MAG: dihydropteroate synthase [Kiritimatiellae bacterium]|nr:dihydropteroate synthase [Kiritimatiellia bacterium]